MFDSKEKKHEKAGHALYGFVYFYFIEKISKIM